MTKRDLFASGKLKDPEFVKIARETGLGDIVDELLLEMEVIEGAKKSDL